jgi:DNA invertase Pin-like site-specific DNA recombinase
MKTYEESLKTYWDNYSVLQTARDEGKQEERIEIAREMKKDNEPAEKIMKYTGLTREQLRNYKEHRSTSDINDHTSLLTRKTLPIMHWQTIDYLPITFNYSNHAIIYSTTD